MFKHVGEGGDAGCWISASSSPGYDGVIKCSHLFNVLDARGAISVSERVGYIARVRKLARKAASAVLAQREALGFPLLRDEAERAKLDQAGGNGRGDVRAPLPQWPAGGWPGGCEDKPKT